MAYILSLPSNVLAKKIGMLYSMNNEEYSADLMKSQNENIEDHLEWYRKLAREFGRGEELKEIEGTIDLVHIERNYYMRCLKELKELGNTDQVDLRKRIRNEMEQRELTMSKLCENIHHKLMRNINWYSKWHRRALISAAICGGILVISIGNYHSTIIRSAYTY